MTADEQPGDDIESDPGGFVPPEREKTERQIQREAEKESRRFFADRYGFTEPFEVEQGGAFGLMGSMFGATILRFMDCKTCGSLARYVHPCATYEDHINSPMILHWLSHATQKPSFDLQVFMEGQQAEFAAARQAADEEQQRLAEEESEVLIKPEGHPGWVACGVDEPEECPDYDKYEHIKANGVWGHDPSVLEDLDG